MSKVEEQLEALTKNFINTVEPQDRENLARVLDAFTQGVLLGYKVAHEEGGDK